MILGVSYLFFVVFLFFFFLTLASEFARFLPVLESKVFVLSSVFHCSASVLLSVNKLNSLNHSCGVIKYVSGKSEKKTVRDIFRCESISKREFGTQ